MERPVNCSDWKKPSRLLTLENGDAVQEQVVFLAYGAPGWRE